MRGLLLSFTIALAIVGRQGASPVTRYANALATSVSEETYPAILPRQWVSLYAMRLLSVCCHDTLSSENIGLVSDKFQMGGVYTRPVPTQMVNFQISLACFIVSSWNGPNEIRVRYAVSVHQFFVHGAHAIPVVQGSRPWPTGFWIGRRSEQIQSIEEVHAAHAMTRHGTNIDCEVF